jgi:hypothetical protein
MNDEETAVVRQERADERAAHARSGTRFTSETAREAAQKSAEARREKAARRAEAAQLDQLTIRQRLAHELNDRKHRIPAILDALHTAAERGSVPAARELRGWYDQGLGKPDLLTLGTGNPDEHKSIEDMTPEERAAARAGVIREIARLEAAQVEESGQAEA